MLSGATAANMDPPSLSKDAATEPDIMNDPAYDTNTQGRQKGTEEPDTCRICRGEGSKEEPLFYPCKCSGSIKFVHQGCLLEWLSHSQKKHCELCKTSFRFTKLYHPQMPSTVPMTIFMKRAALHTLRSLLTWARWNLVTFVWLIWVPWCMRTVWRGLFWIGDGGWATQYGFQRQTTQSRPDLSSITTTTSGGHSTATDTYHPLRGLTLGWSPISQTLNFSSAEPNMVRIAKKLSGWLFYAKFYSDRVDNSTATTNSSAAISQRSPSLLSDLNFLKALTRWHTLNNLIIDVLEGQLITLCVVIAFILIFLIREWVVQQQPAINMGANMDIGARDIEDELEETDAEDGDDEDEERSDEGSNEQDELPELEPVRDTEQQMEVERRERPIARARVARHLRRPLEPTGDDQQRSNTQGQQAELHSTEIDHNDSQLLQSGDPTQQPTITGPGPSSLAQRPTLPTRDALARATEIQRTLEEQSRTSGKDWPGLDVFMDLWKRADSNPSGVLTLIQQEGRQDELGWIVAAMERLEAADGKLPVGSRFGNKELPNEQLSEKSDGSWQSVNNRDGSDAGGIESEEQVSVLIENPLGSKSASLPITTPEHHSSPDYEETNPPSKVSLPVGSQGISEISSITQDSSPLQSPVDPQNSHERPSSYVDPVASHDADEHMATSDLTADIHEPLLSTSDDANPAEHHNDQSTAVTHSNDDHGQDQQPAQNLSEAIKNWLWGGVPIQIPLAEDPGEDVEHIVEDVANEAPFMPVAQGQLVINDANAPVAPVVVAVEAAAEAVPAEHNEIQQDPDVLRAAAEAGIDPDDPEAVEDGEDLEGVMELIGMQGPLAGLFQNGMFSAVLISLSIFFGLWIPYISGKALLVFLANPISLTFKLPLRWASTIADIILDVCIFVAGCAFYWIDAVVRLVCSPVGWLIPCIGRIQQNKHVPETVKGVIWKAGERLSKSFIATGGQFSDSDIPVFSVIAHEALNNIECKVTNATRVVFHGIQTVAETPIYDIITLGKIKALIETLANTAILAFYTLIQMIQRMVSGVPSLLLINPLRISLDIPRREEPLDYSLAYWNTRDRILAIILGYILFCAGGALYLRIRNTFRDNQEEDKADGPFVEILNQAGGVIKVILIISIEMIVFPLYCGMLLDIALLPLFDKATIVSRLRFTASSPATSLFVHWFVGTCYMFHFALFVSMCRKIMRTGVLCELSLTIWQFCGSMELIVDRLYSRPRRSSLPPSPRCPRT